METKTLFNTLNSLRAVAGLKPLKAWKESRAKLEAAIDTYGPPGRVNEKLAAMVYERAANALAAKNETPEARLAKGKEILKKAKAARKATARQVNAADFNASGDITLVEIAESIKMDPRVARAKMRRNPLDLTTAAKYAYAAGDVAAVIAHLRADRRIK